MTCFRIRLGLCLALLSGSVCVFAKERIKAEPLSLDRVTIRPDEVLGNPRALFLSDGKLVMATSGGDRIFHIFPLPLTGECFSDIHEGRGPGEIQSLDYKSLATVGPGFWFIDGKGPRMGEIEGQKVKISTTGSSLRATATRNGLVRLGEGFVDLNTDVGSENEYVLYDNNFRQRTPVGKFPKWDRTGTLQPMFSYVKFMAGRPDGERFVSAYVRFPKVRIYDSRVKMLKDVDMNFSRQPLDPNKAYYVCKPSVDQTRIYLLSHNGENGTAHPELQILDWNGKVWERYVLNTRVDLIAVDFDTRVLYAISYESPDEIYYARLPRP